MMNRRNLVRKASGRCKDFIRNLDRGYLMFRTRTGLYSACPGSGNEFDLENKVYMAEKVSGSGNIQVGAEEERAVPL